MTVENTGQPVAVIASEHKWSQWCELFDAVEKGLYEAHCYRWMWRVVNGIIDQSGVKKEPALIGYLTKTYVAYVASFVRRETDDRRDAASLLRCIRFLESNPDTLTRPRYMEMLAAGQSGESVNWSAIGFDIFAPTGGDVLERAQLARRRTCLTEAAACVCLVCRGCPRGRHFQI